MPQSFVQMTTTKKDAVKNLLAPKLRFKEFKEEWPSKTLESVALIARGKSKHRPRDASFLYGGKYPFIQTGDIRNAELYITTFTQTYSEEGLKQSKLWDEGTLCITIAANIAETAILKIKACFPDSVIGLIPREGESDTLFVKHLFDKFKISIQSLSQGLAQANLNLEKLSSLKLNFPTLPEQQKIAAFLSAVNEKIQQLARKKELLTQYKKGVMQQLFSSQLSELRLEGLKDDRINADQTNPSILKSKNPARPAGGSQFRQLRFRQDNGKPYPKWEEKRLGDVLELHHGYQFRSSDFTKEGLAIIKIGNVIGNSLDLNDLSFIDSSRYDEFNRFEIKKGDILMSLTGNIGRVVEVDSIPFTLIQNYRVGKFVPYDAKYLAKSFVKYLLMSDMVFGRFNQLSNQSAQANFGKQDMDKINVLIPSIEEQQKIASFLTALDAKIETVNNQITQTQAFKKGLLQQMFV